MNKYKGRKEIRDFLMRTKLQAESSNSNAPSNSSSGTA